MQRALVLLVSATAATAGCGYTDEGDGTNTLEVQATITYRAGSSDAMFPNIRVIKDGVDVAGATVTLTDGDSGASFMVTEDANNCTMGMGGGCGRYDQASISGYHRRLALSVVSGSDNVEGQLEGPGRHFIDEPLNAAVHVRTDPLNIEWSTADGIVADEVTIELDVSQFEHTDREDTGTFEVEPVQLRPGGQQLEHTRRNRVELTGGTGPSRLVIEYEIQQDITINEP